MPRPAFSSAMLPALVAAFALASCGEDADTPGPLHTTVTFGETGRFPGQFAYPRAIDSHGDAVIVLDKAARLQRIDPATGDFLGGWSMPDSADGKPTGLTVAPHPFTPGRDALYVADTHYYRVLVYELPRDPLEATSRRFAETPPEPILTLGSFGTELGQFIFLTDVAIVPSGDPASPVERIFVSEYGGNDRITAFDRVGERFQPAFAFGSPGRATGTPGSREGIQFNRPQSIAVEPSRRELLVTDSSNHRIGRFTLDGELIAWIGVAPEIGVEPDELRYPFGIAVLNDGTALITEFGGNRVRRLDPASGTFLATYGEAGRGAGQLASPWGVTVIGRTAYVLDSGNNRIHGFRAPAPAIDLAEFTP